jgi:alcohol dehydrogenase class IV
MGVIEAMKAVFLHHVPMGASHGIGHQLGPLGVGHGETSCILLPAVCAYNYSVNSDRQKKVCDILWDEPDVAELLRSKHLSKEAQLSEPLDVVIRELGMPRSLTEVGVTEEKFDVLAENSLKDRWCATSPRALTRKEEVLEILGMCKG